MDNSTAFWSITFPALLPFILIVVLFLLWRVIKWLERRKWKPITARVLRIEAIDKEGSRWRIRAAKVQTGSCFPMAECGQVSKLDIPSYIRSSQSG